MNFDFETCAKLHFQSSPDRQRAALSAWHAALLVGSHSPVSERRQSLKAVAAEVGRHPSVLWRLGVVKHCGESYCGGRKVYRLSEVLAYLKSPMCEATRAELEIARRKQSTDGM